MPHAPQLFTLDVVSTQPLPQSCEPAGQLEHTPFVQAAPGAQALSHEPQCSGVLLRYTQY